MNQSTNRKARNGAIPGCVKQENDLKVTRNNKDLWIGYELEPRQTSKGDRDPI